MKETAIVVAGYLGELFSYLILVAAILTMSEAGPHLSLSALRQVSLSVLHYPPRQEQFL